MKTKIILFGLILLAISAGSQSSSYYGDAAVIGGQDNAGFGFNVLLNLSNGYSKNTATGYQAMSSCKFASENVAYGAYTLYNDGPSFFSQGHYNTAVGTYALYNNTTGTENCATGYKAMFLNTTSSLNTATGVEALYTNTKGTRNTATGYRSLYLNNGATVNFGDDNTATGFKALYSNIDGDGNTALGKHALFSNTYGGRNTAAGFEALFSNTDLLGSYGEGNSATGFHALYGNRTGQDNTATSYNALLNNDDGIYNTANGAEALQANTTGNSNTAMGINALYNSTGDYNTGVGINALYNTSTGNYNTAVGADVLMGNTSGNYNTAAGYAAGVNDHGSHATKDENTYFGAYTRLSGPTGLGNLTAIGYFANNIKNTNAVRIGDPNVTVVETQLGWFVSSDGRFKYNVNEDDVKGLEFIKKLKPVVYNFDTKKMAENLSRGLPEDLKKNYLNKDFSESMTIRQSGFLAQEVEQAAKETGYIFDGIQVPSNENDYYSLSYGLFVVPLVKAVQQQTKLLAESALQNKVLQESSDQLEIEIQELLKSNTSAPTSELYLETTNDKTGDLNLNYKVKRDGKTYFLGIYDLNGAEIIFNILKESDGTITLPRVKLPSATYLMSISSNGEPLITNKLIIE